MHAQNNQKIPIRLLKSLTHVFMALFVLNFTPAFASDLALPVKKSEQAKLSKKEKFIHWIQNRHSPKNLGIDDPDLPCFVNFKPVMIPLPWGYHLPKQFVVRDDHLDMRSLTPKVLESLKPAELQALLEYLATVPVDIKWSNQKGHTKSGKKIRKRTNYLKRWEESNAAAALALTMGVSSEQELFTTMIALAPEAILPDFRGSIPGLLDARRTAEIIGNMLAQLKQGNSSHLARIIAFLTERGLSYWVAKDITKLNPYLAELFSETFKILEEQNPKSREAVTGLMLGSVLAGTMHHVHAIKRTDEKRIWIVGVVSNLVWAATSFIACIPVATPIAAATAGGISVGAVLSTVVYTALDFPRDFSPSVKQIEGNLETAALESTLVEGLEEKVNVLLMLSWMHSAIHANSLND